MNRRALFKMFAWLPFAPIVAIKSPRPDELSDAWRQMIESELFASFPGEQWTPVTAETRLYSAEETLDGGVVVYLNPRKKN